MTMKAWFIDEDKDQRETYAEFLDEILGDTCHVEGIEPMATMPEMTYLLTDQDTVLIIIDEKLKDTGIASYLGIELAVYFRGINKKLPIYILTNHPQANEDFDGSEWSVEDILDKGSITKNRELIQSRLLRRIDTYNDLITNRELRFEALLRKSLDEELTREETTELTELNYLRTTKIAADELGVLDALDAHIKKQEQIINQLEDEKNG